LNLNADELLGAVVERLIKAMREVRPGNVRQFFALANQHMRWELNDLARRLDKRMSVVELHDSRAAAPQPKEPSSQDRRKVSMQRILESIDSLPEEEREVFNLIRIQGMTKAEASAVLGVSDKTVQRRLSRCLVRLTELLGEFRPEAPPSGHYDGAGDQVRPTV
jgi:RNA polymerase sigma-70 factor (ECF subfamily)